MELPKERPQANRELGRATAKDAHQTHRLGVVEIVEIQVEVSHDYTKKKPPNRKDATETRRL